VLDDGDMGKDAMRGRKGRFTTEDTKSTKFGVEISERFMSFVVNILF
jgi:hypothetical protein